MVLFLYAGFGKITIISEIFSNLTIIAFLLVLQLLTDWMTVYR